VPSTQTYCRISHNLDLFLWRADAVRWDEFDQRRNLIGDRSLALFRSDSIRETRQIADTRFNHRISGLGTCHHELLATVDDDVTSFNAQQCLGRNFQSTETARRLHAGTVAGGVDGREGRSVVNCPTRHSD
jgi:hypothetical protein